MSDKRGEEHTQTSDSNMLGSLLLPNVDETGSDPDDGGKAPESTSDAGQFDVQSGTVQPSVFASSAQQGSEANFTSSEQCNCTCKESKPEEKQEQEEVQSGGVSIGETKGDEADSKV